jgi:hypothetical protein
MVIPLWRCGVLMRFAVATRGWRCCAKSWISEEKIKNFCKRRRSQAAIRARRLIDGRGANRPAPGWVAASSTGGVTAMRSLSFHAFVVSFLVSSFCVAEAQTPGAIAAPGEPLIATVHAEGAQVYECKADATGKATWQFREPIATLLIDGKTVGRHYAGPSWELADGSAIVGKVAGRAPGATAKDIPLLKLEVTSQRGQGRLAGVTTIQRLNTRGGVADGPCESVGAFLSVPYSADYAFYKKPD